MNSTDSDQMPYSALFVSQPQYAVNRTCQAVRANTVRFSIRVFRVNSYFSYEVVSVRSHSAGLGSMNIDLLEEDA